MSKSFRLQSNFMAYQISEHTGMILDLRNRNNISSRFQTTNTIKCCKFGMKPGFIGKFPLAIQLRMIFMYHLFGEMKCHYEHSWSSARWALLSTFMKNQVKRSQKFRIIFTFDEKLCLLPTYFLFAVALLWGTGPSLCQVSFVQKCLRPEVAGLWEYLPIANRMSRGSTRDSAGQSFVLPVYLIQTSS